MPINVDVPSSDERSEGKVPCVAVILHPTESSVIASQRQLQVYVQERVNGKSQKAAAQAAGVSVESMRLQGRRIKRFLESKRPDYNATPEEIRELVLLNWLEVALDDDADGKLRMLALSELSRVPEVGLKTTKVVVQNEARRLDPSTEAVLDSLGEEDR